MKNERFCVVLSCLFMVTLLVCFLFFLDIDPAIKPIVEGVGTNCHVRVRVESGPSSETALALGDTAVWNVRAECEAPTVNRAYVIDAPTFVWSVRVEYQKESDSVPVPSQFVPEIIPGPKGKPRAVIRGVFPDAGYWQVFVKVSATWHGHRALRGCVNRHICTAISDEVSLDEPSVRHDRREP